METENQSGTPHDAAQTGRRMVWHLVLLALCSFVAGPVLYFQQVKQAVLVTPWYVPVLATCGSLLLVWSYLRNRSIKLGMLTAIAAGFCALEWFGLTMGVATPDYHGPLAVGRKLPQFATHLANGATFTSENLSDGKRTILVFFRGRW